MRIRRVSTTGTLEDLTSHGSHGVTVTRNSSGNVELTVARRRTGVIFQVELSQLDLDKLAEVVK